MRGEVLGLERLRRWSNKEKLRVVTSVGIDGASVTQIAQRHDVTRQQIYRWRHELKKKRSLPVESSGAFFLAVDIPPARQVPTQVELRFGNGRCLRFDSCIDGVQLAQLIRAVEVT